MMENGEEDRISELPDCLLIEILSHLPWTGYAIRIGALSKRWNHLWTLVPTLIFDDDVKLPLSDFASFVDKTLIQCRPLKLKKFELNIFRDCVTDIQSQVKSWIRYAVSRDVEELTYFRLGVDFSLDQSFFINTCFTDLSLAGCIFNPIGAISWKNLMSLCIWRAKLDEDLIQNILSGSPVLETVVLNSCYGYKRLDITSKSVKNIEFFHLIGSLDIVEIKAPNILSLTITRFMRLRKLLLVNISSLVEASLDYKMLGYQETMHEEEMLKGLIQNLRHVNKLKIGVRCSEHLQKRLGT